MHQSCGIDLLIDDVPRKLRGRPYDLVAVAEGWKHWPAGLCRRYSHGGWRKCPQVDLAEPGVLVPMCSAYFQPIIWPSCQLVSEKRSAETDHLLRGAGLIASGPRSPTTGVPYTYVITRMLQFGFDTRLGLPDFEVLENAGLLSKERLLGNIMPDVPALQNNDDAKISRPQRQKQSAIAHTVNRFGRHSSTTFATARNVTR